MLAITSKYDFIDVTRALAAFVVVVSHTQQIVIDRPLSPGIMHEALSMLTTQGHNAVVVFFVISGFWIVRSVVRSGDRFSFKDYMLARGVRLWIVLLPALLLGAILDVAGSTFFASPLYEGTQGSVALTYDVTDRLTWSAFLGNAVFLQDIAVPAFGSNGALWTIACEFWYYVYFPLAWLAMRSRNPIAIAAAIGGLLLVPAPHLFLCWMMGGAVYLIGERLMGDRNIHWSAAVAAFAVFCALNALSKLLGWPAALNDISLAVAFAAFMVFGMRSSFGSARPFGWVAQLGSRSSYSLYAIHLPVVVFISNFLVPTTRIPASIYSWALVAFIPLVCVGLAVAFSRVTENQTGRLRMWAAGVLARPTERSC